MGNVISNDPPIPKRSSTTHHAVFNVRHAVILADTVDARLAKLFLVQVSDPTVEEHWSTHIQKTALRLIRLRLQDEMYRTLVPENEINIWPRRLSSPPGMARLFVKNTKAELKGGLDTVEKACNRVKKLLLLVRQAIRIASSYGPEEYVFRIESKDKEIPSCPPTHDHNQHTNTKHDKCSSNDVTAATPAMVTVGTRQTTLQMGETPCDQKQ
jgi:hypothetical protein